MGLLHLWDFLGPFPGTDPKANGEQEGGGFRDDAERQAAARLFEIIPAGTEGLWPQPEKK